MITVYCLYEITDSRDETESGKREKKSNEMDRLKPPGSARVNSWFSRTDK